MAFGPVNLGVTRDEARERAAAQLERLGIAHTADRSPFDLSGGQQRLAALAGVLVMEPEVVIMDEPLSGLDPVARASVRTIIRNLVNDGVAILMITHSMDDAARAARIVVLNEGTVVLEGTPHEVFAHDELLASIGLGIPDAMRAGAALKRAGAALTELPLTLEGLADALAGEVR